MGPGQEEISERGKSGSFIPHSSQKGGETFPSSVCNHWNKAGGSQVVSERRSESRCVVVCHSTNSPTASSFAPFPACSWMEPVRAARQPLRSSSAVRTPQSPAPETAEGAASAECTFRIPLCRLWKQDLGPCCSAFLSAFSGLRS